MWPSSAIPKGYVVPEGYVAAIPSYKRSGIPGKMTLATLQAHGIEPGQIFVFVASAQEKAGSFGLGTWALCF